jgi:hypothetical protein
MYPQVIQFETRKIEREAEAQLARERACEMWRSRWVRVLRRPRHIQAYS